MSASLVILYVAVQDDLRRLGRPARRPRPAGGVEAAASAADTIFALSSGRPPAAIAMVRTSGPGAFDAGKAWRGRCRPRGTAALRGFAIPQPTAIDEALVLRFDAPASATGEDVVEYQCHGGRAVVDAVLGALVGLPGMRMAEPGEFTRRAFANGRIDLTEAEGLADLLEAETESQRRAALAGPAAGSGEARGWRHRLVALSARAEAAIDYVDDEDGCGTMRRSAGQARACRRAEGLVARRGWSRCKRGCGSSSQARRTPENRALSMRWRKRRAIVTPLPAPRATRSKCRWRSTACRSCWSTLPGCGTTTWSNRSA